MLTSREGTCRFSILMCIGSVVVSSRARAEIFGVLVGLAFDDASKAGECTAVHPHGLIAAGSSSIAADWERVLCHAPAKHGRSQVALSVGVF